MPIGENGVCVAPRCDTSAECGPKECCVSNVRPIGKRDTLLQPRGRCQPMGEEGKGNRSQRNIIELIPCVDGGLGDQGSGPPGKRKSYWVPYRYWSDNKATKSAFNVGSQSAYQRNAIFKCRLGGGPMMAHF